MSNIYEYNGILINQDNDRIIPEQGLTMLTKQGFYKRGNESSPQETFARAATCYSFGDYEFAQRIYDYRSKGWMTFASPVQSNAINIEWPTFKENEFEKASQWLEENVTPDGMPISCFEGSAPVYTSEGIKNIKDISVGDMVLTHKGRFRKVEATRESKSSDIYELQCSTNRTKVKVTGNHRMLTNLGWVRVDELVKGKHLIAHSDSVDKECYVASELCIETASGSEEYYNSGTYKPKEDRVPNSRNGVPMENGLRYLAIDLLEKVDVGEIYVYDIQVEEDTSFSVGGMIAHNCFLSYVGDSKKALTTTSTETRDLSMEGGGIGIKFANRGPDEKSTGVMAHLRTYDADALAYRQTKSRRGSIGAYIDIDHPEILQFINARNPIGGDFNKKCFNINNAVCIPDSFMIAMIKGEEYELIDPKHGPTGTFLDARDVWYELMELRKDTGEPYILFVDTVNRNLPSQIMNPTYHVNQSNLCSEITLMTNDKRTAVCCLSSLNLAKFQEWKDTNIVQDMVRLLDNVLEFFIRLAGPELSRAVRSACKERAIGIGTLGWHSFLQSEMIPFESGGLNSAAQWTHKIYSLIKSRASEESIRLGGLRGESPDCQGSGYRNSHLLAIAPNASTADLVGESPSIEPYSANAYLAQGRAGSFLKKNKYLEALLESKGKNTKEVWASIMRNDGSVQHLEEDILTEFEKSVFKTAKETSPQAIIEMAAIRQKEVCQSQSLNIWTRKGMTAQEMSDIHVLAWIKGIKSLYYARGEETTKADVGDGSTAPLNAVKANFKIDFNECVSCEG